MSTTHRVTLSLNHSFVRSFIHSFIHACIHCNFPSLQTSSHVSQLTNHSYTLAPFYSHFLFSKLPPWRAPGIIWYTWYYKGWKKTMNTTQTSMKPHGKTIKKSMTAIEKIKKHHGNIDENNGITRWNLWNHSMQTMETLDETHRNRWTSCKNNAQNTEKRWKLWKNRRK